VEPLCNETFSAFNVINVSDAQMYMQEKALDIENSCFAPELGIPMNPTG